LQANPALAAALAERPEPSPEDEIERPDLVDDEMVPPTG
jgi:hypothetical protein